jgi:hypothetical protein
LGTSLSLASPSRATAELAHDWRSLAVWRAFERAHVAFATPAAASKLAERRGASDGAAADLGAAEHQAPAAFSADGDASINPADLSGATVSASASAVASDDVASDDVAGPATTFSLPRLPEAALRTVFALCDDVSATALVGACAFCRSASRADGDFRRSGESTAAE